MQRASCLGLLAVLVLGGATLAAPGCSSTEPPGHDASAQGGSGSGGQPGGAGGAPGADAGATCQSLIQDYASAFEAARACSPFLSIVQCGHLESSGLQCPGCPVYVNDTTRLDAIRAAFEARTDCPILPCPLFLCVNPGTSGRCVENDGGPAGTCVGVP